MEWGGSSGGGGAYSYPSRASSSPRTYSSGSSGGGYSSSSGSSGTSRTSSIVVSQHVPKSLETKSLAPLVVACDVTGSMSTWPKIIFDKLPLLYGELERAYFKGQKPEISFAAVGDAYCDRYPLQVQAFSKGKSLDSKIKKLIAEGGGGGQIQETYELAGLYYARNVSMPNATKPVFIMIGDEKAYDYVNPDQAEKWAHSTLKGRLPTKEVFKELQEKFSVYMVRKLYDGGSSYGDGMSSTDRDIQNQWESYLGKNRIAILPDPSRVVDVILGIVANDTGMGDYFNSELTSRQSKSQVGVVQSSLHAISSGSAVNKSGRSITRRKTSGKKAGSLVSNPKKSKK